MHYFHPLKAISFQLAECKAIFDFMLMSLHFILRKSKKCMFHLKYYLFIMNICFSLRVEYIFLLLNIVLDKIFYQILRCDIF